MEKRKLRTRTYEEKFENLKYFEEHPGVKKKDVAEKFTISPKHIF